MPDYEYDVFLSYNRAQKDWTRDLARRIRDAGFKVWFDEWMLKAGDNWIDKLAECAAKSNKIAPIMSPEYLNSEWGNFEANVGIQEDPSGKNDRILLILHSNCTIPPKFAQRQGVNFCATHGDKLAYEHRLSELLHALDSSRHYIEDFEVFSKMQDKELADALPKVGVLPSGSVMTYSPNPNFVGREDELKSLYKMLQAGSSAALAQTAVATGLGGIGKTQLAVEFAYRYGRRYDGGVYWVSMADPESVPDQLYRFAAPDAMNISGYGSAPRDDLIALVKKEWGGLRKRLVIFDNAEDLNLISKWKVTGGGTCFLVTSRINEDDYRWKDRGIGVVPVKTLPRDKSLQLLCRGRCEDLDDPKQKEIADKICELLGDLPLAIHIAGSYLIAHSRIKISLKEYYDKLCSQPVLKDKTMVDYVRDPSPTEHIQNVSATFDISYQRLDQKDKVDALSARIFHLTSHFAPAPIPTELLFMTLKMDKDNLDDKDMLNDAINRLCELGLVEMSQDGRVIVHRLLREFAYHHPADGQDVEQSAEDIAQAIVDYSDKINDSNIPMSSDDIEHLRHTTNEAENRKSKLLGRLNYEIGYYLYIIADLKGAMEHSELALKIDETIYGKDHPNVAIDVNIIGLVLYYMGDFKGAKEYLERALKIDEAIYGEDHSNVAEDVSNIGLVLQDMGNLKGAKEYYERALKIGQATYGEDHPMVSTCLNNIGSVLQDMGDLKGAKEYLERALRIDEATYGEDHPNVAIKVNNIGMVLEEMGDLKGAKEYLERALKIDEAIYGEDHPNVARDVNNIGSILKNNGDLKGAKVCFERALKIYEKFEKSQGIEHPNMKTLRANLRIVEALLNKRLFGISWGKWFVRALRILENLRNFKE